MKKISADSYAEALIAVLQKSRGTDTVVKNFIKAVRKNNDWARRRQICETCDTVWRRTCGKSLITIESARELSSEQRKRLSAQWKKEGHDVEYKINSSIIAGVKIVMNEERQFDGSLKRKLNKIFA